MKKILFMLLVSIPLCLGSCEKTNGVASPENEKDTIQTDTLKAYLQRLDSVNNSGELRHLNVYKLGKLSTHRNRPAV